MIVRRGSLTDHYVEDERSVVMVDESVLGLSPIATTILQAVPDGAEVTLERLTEHVVNTFGPPEGPDSAQDLTLQQVWDLVAHRVLVVVDDGIRRTTSLLGHERRDDSQEAVAAIRSAVRHLRSGDDRPWRAPESVDARALVDAARQHHLVPYLAAHLDRLDLRGQVRSELHARANHQRVGAEVLAADLSAAVATLTDAGIRVLAFKGVALATQAYGDFSRRGAGDLDLLVAPADLERAHAHLSAAGWTPAPGWPTPGNSWAWRHFVRTSNEVLLSGPRSDIDLHWHLVPSRDTFPLFDQLWERRAELLVDGRLIPTLSAYDALAHSAGHAAKDGWRWLRSLLDVHVLASQPATWLSADRPLRADQLLSLGLSVRAFGLPPGSPQVVEDAWHAVTEALWRHVNLDQVATAAVHEPFAIPGITLATNLRGVGRTGAPVREVARLVSRSALPSWIAADEPSPHALIAVPRVASRRLRDVASRLLRTRGTRRVTV